jgi:hypothetical protein
MVAKLKDVYSRVRPKDLTAPRVLARKPRTKSEGHSARRLNQLTAGMKSCDSYLEVGVAQGLTLEQVRVKTKIGVDPTPQFDLQKLPKGTVFYQVGSDSFFAQHAQGRKFDLIFLDGLHLWTQTYKDLLNSLSHGKSGSIILLDDVIPDNELSAFPDWDEALRLKEAAGHLDSHWQGDVYKVLIAVSLFHPELDYCVIGQRDGIDNPQALVWKRPGKQVAGTVPASKAQIQAVSDTQYSEAFPNNEPTGVFAMTPEGDGIARALNAVQ